MCVFFSMWCCRYVFGVVFNGLTLTLGKENRGLTVHCGLLYGHNIYSLGLVLVTGGSRTLLDITVHTRTTSTSRSPASLMLREMYD